MVQKRRREGMKHYGRRGCPGEEGRSHELWTRRGALLPDGGKKEERGAGRRWRGEEIEAALVMCLCKDTCKPSGTMEPDKECQRQIQ